MDGNRRYAKKVHLDQLRCYNLGFEKIRDVSICELENAGYLDNLISTISFLLI